jgi:hypothetical protein
METLQPPPEATYDPDVDVCTTNESDDAATTSLESEVRPGTRAHHERSWLESRTPLVWVTRPVCTRFLCVRCVVGSALFPFSLC